MSLFTQNITSSLETITPADAKKLLEINKNNRPISKANIHLLATAMKKGQWVINGDVIRIDIEGNLLDGQHRLHALISANYTCETFVTRNLPRETFDTIDQGAARQLGQLLAMGGTKNYNTAASIIGPVMGYEVGKSPNSSGGKAFTKHDKRIRYEKNKARFDEAAAFAVKNRFLRDMTSGGYLGFAFYIFNDIDRDDTELFFEALNGNTSLGIISADNLQERLRKEFTSTSKKIDRVTKCAFLFKAWNSYRKGEKIKVFKWIGTGENKEAFPRAI